MKKVLFVIIVLSGICPLVFGGDKLIIKETRGIGRTRDEAIQKALYQALSQALGVKVSSGEYRFGYKSATADIEKDGSKKEVEFDAVSVQTGGTVLSTEIGGYVKTYEVLKEQKISESQYDVKLKVWVFDYESPDKTKRLRLAVMPMRSARQSFMFGFLQPGEELSRQLSQRLSTALAGTNKFAVLDRKFVAEFARERGILLSDDTSLQEKAKLGKVLGADYMLVGSISDALLVTKVEQLAATGHSTTEYKARFVFEYQLLTSASRQIKLADIVELKFKTEDIKALFEEWKPKEIDIKEVGDKIIAEIARQTVEMIIDRLYPVRIASVAGSEEIVINQGGKRIHVGMRFDVIVEGKEIIDFDTKESLGKTHKVAAVLEVTKVLSNFSYAKIISGDPANISVGLICDPKKTLKHESGGLKSKIKRTSGGGVKLPFD